MLSYMGGCQNCGPILGPLNTWCRLILRTQTETIILITTHVAYVQGLPFWLWERALIVILGTVSGIEGVMVLTLI